MQINYRREKNQNAIFRQPTHAPHTLIPTFGVSFSLKNNMSRRISKNHVTAGIFGLLSGNFNIINSSHLLQSESESEYAHNGKSVCKASVSVLNRSVH